MTPFALALIVVTLSAGVGAAVSKTAGWPGYGSWKMVAATGYLAFALHLDALGSAYGRILFAALALSWLGDLLLIGEGRRSFLAGLGAFLLAHVAYAVAFGTRGVEPLPALVGGGMMVVVGVAVLVWLRAARLGPAMRAPIIAYLLAIGAMVAMALGTMRAVVVLGAVAFAVSDILVARERFVVRAPVHRWVGLPLYFTAQLLLASSL